MKKETFQNTGEGQIDSIAEKYNTRFLAGAMTFRSIKESERVSVRIAQLTGEKYTVPDPAYTGAIMFAGTKIYEKILTTKPSLLPSAPQKLAATYLDSLSSDLFKEVNRGETGITESQSRFLCKEVAGEAFEKLFPVPGEKGAFIHLLKEVGIAKEIGEKKSVNPAEVYNDDELYLELSRRSESLSKTAKDALETIKTITPEKMMELHIKNFQFAGKILNELTEDKITCEEVEKIKSALMEDPEFKREMREKAEKYKIALKTVMVEDIVRLWGQEGFDSLPGLTKIKLAGEEKIDHIAS